MSEKNYNELKKSLDSKCFDNLYLLTGETALIDYFQNRIIAETLGKTYTDFDITILKSESISIEKIEDALNTFPITTNKKCVVLQDIPWENLTEEDETYLLKILSDLPEFAVLIISQISSITGSKHSKKFLKVKNLVKNNGTFSNLSQKDFPMEKQLILWAKRDFNKKLDTYTAKKILHILNGYQIYQIKNELQKICQFEKGPEITEQSLNIAWKPENKISVFSVSKAWFSKNISACLQSLSSLFAQNEDPLYILNIIIMDFIDIYRVKLFFEENQNYLELTQIFDYKNKEFRLKNAEKIAKKLTLNDIDNIFKCLIAADEKLKNSTINPEVVLSGTVVSIMKIIG